MKREAANSEVNVNRGRSCAPAQWCRAGEHAGRLLYGGLCAVALMATLAFAQQPADDDDDDFSDPVLRAVLESDPQTPAEMLRSLVVLVDLGKPRLAEPLLKQLVAAKLDEEALADLAEQVQTPALLRLGRAVPELGPQAAALTNAIIDAADRRSRDPQRLAGLVGQLKDPAREVRQAAVFNLIRARESGVVYLLAALADENRADEHAVLESALVEMGATAVQPLLGALETNHGAFKARVINVLGRLSPRRALPFVVASAVSSNNPELREAALRAIEPVTYSTPTPQSAAELLYRQVQRYLGRMLPVEPDHEGMVELWHWDDAQRQSTPHLYRAEDASMVIASRLSRDLYSLNPQNVQYRRLWLASALEAARVRHGLDEPLPTGPGSADEHCKAAGPDAVEDLLDFAMQQERLAAATEAARILGDIGTARIVLGEPAKLAPLVRAAQHSDRRLRFAALGAIVRLDPPHPYAGSSAVPEALAWFAGTSGTRRALVAHPSAAAGQDLVALLGELGYESDAAYTGKQLIQMATRWPDVELVLVHAGIARPDMREAVYELRRTGRTGSVPIGLIASVDQLSRAQQVAREDVLADAFPPPVDAESLAFQIERLHERNGRSAIPDEVRMQQARLALEWLAQLAAKPRKFYDLRRQVDAVEQALFVPGLAAPAAEVLARLGTSAGQRALVDLASGHSAPLEDRRAAAEAFRDCIGRHGILLTSGEILRQYDRYNASETADRDTQLLLGGILDALEGKSEE